MTVFERFTQQARRAVALAKQEARHLGHGSVGTEHLLLGLLCVDDGVAADVLRGARLEATDVRQGVIRRIGSGHGVAGSDADALRAIGIDIDAVREKVERSFGKGALDRPASRRRRAARRQSCTASAGEMPFSPRAKKVLELSLREALALQHSYIGTEHILLALLREGAGLAARVLVDHGLRLDEMRRQVLSALGRVA